MIEKLGIFAGEVSPADMKIAEKINELVDAVNVLQAQVAILEEHAHPTAKVYEEAQDMYDNAILDALKSKEVDVVVKPADPYAEQRKWIGKLCEFWDNDDTQQLSYGVLTKIDTESGFGVQYCCNDEYDYDNCEPVKPDDDIIYKGGDNE